MFRAVPYTLLLIVVALLQIFVFDRMLLFSTTLPIAYITFILLLPMHTSQLRMLMWGLGIGMLFDLLMGMAGVNTIATLLVCYLRGFILNQTVGGEIVALGTTPTPRFIGERRFWQYTIFMVLLHLTTLFLVEALSFESPLFLLQRVIFSGAITMLFVRLISGRFEQLLARNI